MARTSAGSLAQDGAEKPRRGIRLIDKVRNLSGEFDFSALISGVKEQRPLSEEPAMFAAPPVVVESPVPPPVLVHPAAPAVPIVLAEHAAELQNIWKPAAAVQESTPTAPPPWEVRVPAHRSESPVRVIRATGRQTGMDFPTCLRGTFRRSVLCLTVVLLGAGMGAAGVVVLNQLKPQPAYASQPANPGKATPSKDSPDPGLMASIQGARTPLAILGCIAAAWVLGLPLALGSLQRGAFAALVLSVLLTSSWAGSASALQAIQSRAGPPAVKKKSSSPSKHTLQSRSNLSRRSRR